MSLGVCASCRRHIRVVDAGCPFCRASTPRHLSGALVVAVSALVAAPALAETDAGLDASPDAATEAERAAEEARRREAERFVVPLYGVPPSRNGCGCEVVSERGDGMPALGGIASVMAAALIARRRKKG